MGETVNLRQARKQRDRDAARKTADANAAKHGLTKVAKALAKARADKARADLDAHRRDPAGGPADAAEPEA